MKQLYMTIISLILGISVSHAEQASQPKDYKKPYAKLLKQHVQQGSNHGIQAMLVDYKGWSQNPLHPSAMKQLQQTKLDGFSLKEKMTFWINAYNLLTIDLIIQQQEKESIRNLGSWFKSPWKKYEWKIGERTLTLDAIEHEILRKMGEPRIHMAINCASLSCPDLRPEPYDTTHLEKQLEEQTQQFIQNPEKGVKWSKNEMTISKIFDWFEDDFGTEEELLQFILKYSPSKQNVPSASIEGYLDYNWKLNGTWSSQ